MGTVVNLIGILALIIGIAETQQLDFRNPDHKHITVELDLDMTLLRSTSVFVFLYMMFTIITAVFSTNITHFHTISIVSGIAAIMQIAMQIAFIYNLKYRVSYFKFFRIISPLCLRKNFVFLITMVFFLASILIPSLDDFTVGGVFHILAC